MDDAQEADVTESLDDLDPYYIDEFLWTKDKAFFDRVIHDNGLNPNGSLAEVSLLTRSISLNNYDLAGWLLEAGASVDHGGEQGRPPLTCAASSKNVTARFLQLLLDRGADVNIRSHDGTTPLLEAATRGILDKVEMLISAGADVNVANDKGFTGIHQGALYAELAIVKKFLAEGADPNGLRCERTAAGLLSERAPLHLATVVRHADQLELIRALLQAGADVNIATGNGTTLLHTAATNGQTDVAWLALEYGTRIDGISFVGGEPRTPLMCAVWWNQAEMVRLLVQAGADVDFTDRQANSEGWTPFLTAAKVGSKEILKTLLEDGCRTDVRLTNGDGALDLAISYRKHHLISLLVAIGCSLSLNQQVALEALNEHPDSKRELQEYFEQPRTLKAQLRIIIRGVLGRRPIEKIDKLPVPPQLKCYLKLMDIL